MPSQSHVSPRDLALAVREAQQRPSSPRMAASTARSYASYGLLGLVGGAKQEDGYDAAALFESYRAADETDPLWSWPEHLLPVVHLGCAMFFCVDASTEDGMVVWFEPNPHEDGKPWTDSFIPLGLSFEDFMLAWVAGEDVIALMERACDALGSTSEDQP